MTTKEFFAKHYGSLSVALFGIALLALLALYGSSFNALTSGPAKQPDPVQTQVVPASEQVLPQQDETITQQETTDSDKDPLEQAIAEEAAKAEERREQMREDINKEREAAGLPLLPANEASDSTNGP